MKRVRIDFRLALRGGPLRERIAACFLPMLVLLFTGLLIVFFEWLHAGYDGRSFTEGRPSPINYRVISPVKYDDIAITASLREAARDSVVGVIVADVGSREHMRGLLLELHHPELLQPSSSAKKVVPEALLTAISALPQTRRQAILAMAEEIGEAYLTRLASDPSSLTRSADVLWKEISNHSLAAEESNLIYQILIKILDSSYHVDPGMTSVMKTKAERGVPLVEKQLNLGELILAQGEIVTPQAARVLRLQGYREERFPVTQVVIVFLLVLLLPLWLEIFMRETEDNRPSWGCLVFVIATAWIFQTLAAHLDVAGAGVLVSVTMAYLCMPRGFAFNVSLAGTVSGALIITGLSVYNLLLILCIGFAAAMAGYYLLHRVDSRAHLSYKVLALSLSLALLRVIILCLQGFPLNWETLSLTAPVGRVWLDMGGVLLFDLASTMLVASSLPMLEGYIGVLSILRLRELSHPSGPLLRKLQRDAPGTYQHCLSIASLAEAVAVELGMDENLMKVGAYYHDIGKLRRPQFFVENQGGGVNVHDEMPPSLSAFAILSHVRDGLELAKEYGLPKRLRDFITEHHGTTCIHYFYNKARASGEQVDRSAFCYPGPKPRSRETALLMILDSMEAALRSESLGRELLVRGGEQTQEGQDGNRGKSQALAALEKIIDQVIASKINEGQLDEVNLTLKDLTRIRETLLKVLLSIYHTRKVKRIEARRTVEKTS